MITFKRTDISLLSSPNGNFKYESTSIYSTPNPMQTRQIRSTGVWLAGLLPFAYGPGLYSIHSHCIPSPRIASLLAIEVGLASLYVLYDAWKAKHSESHEDVHQTNKSNKSKRDLLIKILKNIYVIPCSITFSALCYFTSLHPVFALGISLLNCYIFYALMRLVVTNFESSFTLGESILVCQGSSLAICLSLLGLILHQKLVTEYQQVVSFVQVAVLTCTLCLLSLWKIRKKLNLLSLALALSIWCVSGVAVSSFLLDEWCFVWLFQLIGSSPTRIALLGWWANLSVLIAMMSFASQRMRHVSQTVMRKVFHLLMVAIILPGVILDPLLAFVASIAATLLFILLEFVRMNRVEPINRILDAAFAQFLDEKDSGLLVLSHIYLLVGLCCPLWLYPCRFTDINRLTRTQLLYSDPAIRIQFSVLPLLAGVLAVGIGDTAASIGGTYLGTHKWPRSKKTIEGSMCSFLLQVVTVTAIVFAGSITVEMESWPKIIISIVINTVVEAFTDQVDNLVLPLILYTPLMDP